MSDVYSKYEHTHAVVRHPDKSDGWEGPHAIILHTGTHVWVHGSHAMQGHREVLQAGTGGPTREAYDEDGNCVLVVPAHWCEFFTPEEAEGIERARDADERLLSHAR